MRAMILAAGRGERMRPLTDVMPKPLLEVAGKALIVYQIEALEAAGVKEVVINTGHLGEQIQYELGTGSSLGVDIYYSDEGENILETAGGIIQALPLLGEDPFIVTNGDIFTDFDYRSLPSEPDYDGHLVLVDNPPHNPQGDFTFENGRIIEQGSKKLTYSGIAVFYPHFFENCNPGRAPLAPLLHRSIKNGGLGGQHFIGSWNDIGTPARLKEVNDNIVKKGCKH
ncbi:MAG: nucleotidyltransferase family protein [Proteobacteria bacterium]|nr:nucleotidyltransferase family protein [Pseudomonadota bacterium]NOG60744.1 nucleotidyltransferase family protein [Pseudomonadota bacterium]